MADNQLVEQKNLIKDFKSKFYADYGINLHVFIPPKEDDKITLNILEIVTLAAFYRDFPELSYIESLHNRLRKKEYITYVQAFSYLAYKLGYNKNRIGRYLNRTHATVINSCRRVEDGMDTKDKFTLSVYNSIIKELENYVGNLPKNIKGKNDSKPISNSIWDQARRLLAIHN